MRGALGVVGLIGWVVMLPGVGVVARDVGTDSGSVGFGGQLADAGEVGCDGGVGRITELCAAGRKPFHCSGRRDMLIFNYRVGIGRNTLRGGGRIGN